MLVGLAVLGLGSGPAVAQMYRWTDDQGGVHYTQGLDSVPDRQRPKAQMMVFPERPVAPVSATSPAEAAAAGPTNNPFTPGVLFVPIQSIEVGTARSGPLRIAAHDVDLSQGDGLLGRDFLDQFKVTIDSTAGIVTIAPK